nr:MAG TPA: E2 early protein-like protein [Caudoviricetes sp.]
MSNFVTRFKLIFRPCFFMLVIYLKCWRYRKSVGTWSLL